MKRGNLGLLILLSILFLPFVSAATDDVLDIFIGSSDSSMIFLRFMYGALIFIIFLNVSKKAIFKSSGSDPDKNSNKLANVFSLILAIFATRFTPEEVVQNFGWVIMVLTPLVIYYFLFGIFTRKHADTSSTDKEGFSWWRFIFALIATLFTLSALGKSNYLGGFPVLGGGLNELFFDVNYLLFDKYLPFLLLLIPLAIIIALISKFGFGGTTSATGTGTAPNIPGWLILGALILFLLFVLGTFIGGVGLPSFGIGIGPWLLYVFGAIVLIVLLILLVRFWPFIGPLLTRFGAWLRNLFRRIPWFRAGPSDRIRIDLITSRRSVNSNTFYRRNLLAEPNVNLPIQVIVSRRSRFWFNERLSGLNLFFSINNGRISPNSITDPNGSASIIYRPPMTNGQATLSIAIAPNPAISSAYRPPNFTIKINSSNLPSDRIRIDLITPFVSVNSNGPTRRDLLADAGTPLPIQIIVSRRRRFWRNERLQNASLTLNVTSGTINPGTINTDPRGAAPVTYNPPNNEGIANLNLTVTHPSIGAAYRPPNFRINIISRRRLIATINPPNTTTDLNTPATFSVNVRNNLGANVSGANVNVIIGNRSLVPPFRRISPITLPSVTTTNLGQATFTTPDLTALGSFNININVIHPDYHRPATNSGTIIVRDPTTPDMDVRITNVPTGPVPVGSPITIYLLVTQRNSPRTVPINNATFTIAPTVPNPPTRVRLSNGLYRLIITPENSQAGTPVTYSVNTSAPSYNPNADTFIINVSALSTMTINVPPSLTAYATRTSSFNASIVDSATNTPVSSTLSVTSNGSPVPARNTGVGQYRIDFTPAAIGSQILTSTARHTLYNNAIANTTINILPIPALNGVLLWSPNPSNSYQLLQINVRDPINGTPISGARVTFTDTHTNPCNNPGTLVTDSSGSFRSQIRFQPRNTIPSAETHDINVTITARGFPPLNISPPLQMTFDPTAVGGRADRRTF